VNYLLFYPDEMRAESLACYGHPVVQTPNFDRVAAEGTVFENAYSTHPVCAPSRASLVTGWFPHVQGHRTLRYLLDDTTPNFFKYLREAGFTTCLAGKNHCFTDEATEASFDRATATFLPKGQDLASFIAGEKTGGNYTMLRRPLPQEEMADDNDFRYVDEGVEFIRDCAREGKPFFLFQSLNSPHPPYTAAERYYHMYDPDKLPPLRDMRWLEGKPALYQLIRKYRELDQQDEGVFRKINAVYLRMISYVDMLLGRLLDALEECGVYDDTTIIICADHGDFGGDAGLVEKWPSAVDDMIARVPLVIRRPGGAAGHRVAAPVQSIDTFPTVCDFEGSGSGTTSSACRCAVSSRVSPATRTGWSTARAVTTSANRTASKARRRSAPCRCQAPSTTPRGCSSRRSRRASAASSCSEASGTSSTSARTARTSCTTWRRILSSTRTCTTTRCIWRSATS